MREFKMRAQMQTADWWKSKSSKIINFNQNNIYLVVAKFARFNFFPNFLDFLEKDGKLTPALSRNESSASLQIYIPATFLKGNTYIQQVFLMLAWEIAAFRCEIGWSLRFLSANFSFLWTGWGCSPKLLSNFKVCCTGMRLLDKRQIFSYPTNNGMWSVF